MDPFEPNINCSDENKMCNNLQETDIANQRTILYYENENTKVVIESNGQPNKTALSPANTKYITDDKLVVLDNDTGRPINKNCYSYYKPETIFLHKLNMSYEDVVKTFREKLVSKMSDGEYVMNNKDAIDLDKMIGLACIAMNESENTNKRLRMRNAILETKCVNHDRVVKERNRLKSELDKIIINLCLALGCEMCNNKEDTEHLINVCAALYAQQNDYHYILIENESLKHALNKRLADIRVKTLNNYDEILNHMDRFKEELFIKDLKLSQVMDDISSIKAENEEKSCIIQLLQERLAEVSNEFTDNETGSVFHNGSQNNNELYEGKSLIAEHINQLEESNVFEAEKCRLSVLIDTLIKMYSNKEEHLETINRHVDDQNQQLTKEIDDLKEWQKHLEDENEKLYLEIENYKRVKKMLMGRENEHNNLKEDYSKMQCMYDKLCKTDAASKTLIGEYRQLLAVKEMRCADSDDLIKTLQCSLTEQTNKFEQANSIYNKEMEKCQSVESNAQRTIEEYTAQIHEKNIEIASIKEECSTLKNHVGSYVAEIGSLKHNISTLEYALNEKNRTLQETLKNLNKTQVHDAVKTTTSSQCNGQLLFHNLSKLEQQMDVILDDMNVCKKKIINYENVLCDMQNAIQQQTKLRDYRMNKHENSNNATEQHKLLKNTIDEKETILLEHRKEMECLKCEHDMNIARLTNREVNLKNQIHYLMESLKLKSSQIIVVEKIASSQLKEASNTIQYATKTITAQLLELNELKSKISGTHNVMHLLKAIHRKSLQLECAADLMRKFKMENKAMKNLCEIRSKKIRYLEQQNYLCTKYKTNF